MTPERWQHVKQIYNQARALPSAEREPALRAACEGDEELAAEVRLLLDAECKAAAFLEPLSPAASHEDRGRAAPHDDTISDIAGRSTPKRGTAEQIGPYRLLQRIGAGGMGEVFLAEQSAPVRRRVALKIIKLGMDTRDVVARFESERQALALMNHPNVAAVYDAGATETGRPYFVMEHVPGLPVTQYCDTHRLSIPERLELFKQICAAVQHAHQKGIIHRDIKPSNILVVPSDPGTPATESSEPQVRGRGSALRAQVKVIDFGIAKATNQRLTEQTVFTQQGVLVGTPEYMSPEQAEMNALDIDTRADIYSLGVVLYELLTGTRPFDHTTLRRAGYAEIQRIIRDVEPQKPSTRLMGLTGAAGSEPQLSAPTDKPASARQSAASIAAVRRCDPRSLAKHLRGDLDWIVMKCLEKDRTRRYDTANALVMEIQRYMANEPVLAGPPSAMYRMRKFTRRNRGSVLAACIVGAALIGATVVSMSFARRATREAVTARAAESRERVQRERAESNERKAREQEALAVQREREMRLVVDFQASQLADIDVQAMGVSLRRQVLAEAGKAMKSAKFKKSERSERLTQLENLLAGTNWTNVAREQLDANIFERALQAATEQFAGQPLVEAKLLQTLASTLRDLGLLGRAAVPQTKALAIRRRILGEEDPETLASIHNMGTLLLYQGETVEAEPYFREALRSYRHVRGEDNPETMDVLNSLGILLRHQGKLAQSEVYHRKALEQLRRVQGNSPRDTVAYMSNLASILKSQGKTTEAAPYFREALKEARRALGPQHPATLGCLINMGSLMTTQGKLAESEDYYRTALELSRRALGDEHPQSLAAMTCLGTALLERGKLTEAEALFREALGNMVRALGKWHRDTLATMTCLGLVLKEQGRFDEATPYYEDVLKERRRVLGDEHPETLAAINNLGYFMQARGNLSAAEPLLRDALEKRRRILGENHPDTITSIGNWASLLEAQGRFADAEPLHREALEKHRQLFGDEHPETLISLNNVGHILEALGKSAEAESYIREALEKHRQVFGNDHARTLGSVSGMGLVLQSQGKLGEAEQYFRQAVDGSRRVLGGLHPQTLTSIYNLAHLLKRRGKLTEAEPYFRESLDGCRRTLGNEHPDTLDSICSMGAVLHARGELADAEAFFRDALAGYQRVFGRSGWQAGNCEAKLGAVLRDLARYADAEQHLLSAARILRTIQGAPADRFEVCVNDIIQLYERWHAAEPGGAHDKKAAEWRKKLAEYRAATQPTSTPASQPNPKARRAVTSGPAANR